MEFKEKIALFFGLFLVFSVFIFSVAITNRPKAIITLEVYDAFDVYYKGGNTFILTRGAGKLRLIGVFDMEIDHSYRIYGELLHKASDARSIKPYTVTEFIPLTRVALVS